MNWKKNGWNRENVEKAILEQKMSRMKPNHYNCNFYYLRIKKITIPAGRRKRLGIYSNDHTLLNQQYSRKYQNYSSLLIKN